MPRLSLLMMLLLVVLGSSATGQVKITFIEQLKEFGVAEAEIVSTVKSRGGLDGEGLSKAEISLRLLKRKFSEQAITELLGLFDGRPKFPPLPVYIRREYRKTESSGPEQIWALAIGVNSYDDHKHLPELSFAEADAEAFAKRLLQVGVPVDQVAVLIGKAVTSERIDALIRELLKAPGTVYLFFSGHGLANARDFYLGCQPTQAKAIKKTAYPLTALKNRLAQMRGQRAVVLLDACHSGAGKASIDWDDGEYDADSGPVTTGKLDKRQHGRIKDLPNDKEIAIITSCRAEQISREGGKGHGLFTEYLLQGLQGKADRDEDGKVNTKELALYVSAAVKDRSDFRQEPDCSFSKSWDHRSDPGLATKVQSKSIQFKLRGAYVIDNEGNRCRSFPVDRELCVKIGWQVEQVQGKHYEALAIDGVGIKSQRHRFAAPASRGVWSYKLPLHWQLQPSPGIYTIQIKICIGQETRGMEVKIHLTAVSPPALVSLPQAKPTSENKPVVVRVEVHTPPPPLPVPEKKASANPFEVRSWFNDQAPGNNRRVTIAVRWHGEQPQKDHQLLAIARRKMRHELEKILKTKKYPVENMEKIYRRGTLEDCEIDPEGRIILLKMSFVIKIAK